MHVSIIVAMDRAGLIGNHGGMPWHLPRDLKRFRAYTWGKPIILGRRTLESLKGPLKGRYNIVLTHKPDYFAAGCQIVHSSDEAVLVARKHLEATGGDEVMIIGGGIVFEEMIHLCDRAYLTMVNGTFSGDTYFPVSALQHLRWRSIDRDYCPADANNPHSHWFLALERQPADGLPSHDFDLSTWLHHPNLYAHRDCYES
jgi:dihydrofolate reductase